MIYSQPLRQPLCGTAQHATERISRSLRDWIFGGGSAVLLGRMDDPRLVHEEAALAGIRIGDRARAHCVRIRTYQLVREGVAAADAGIHHALVPAGLRRRAAFPLFLSEAKKGTQCRRV